VKGVTFIVVAIVLVLILLKGFLYVVSEENQVVVTQLGKPVGVVREPGLHFKIPLIQSVNYFEKRILEYDADPSEVLMRDKKTLVIDNYARWKIADPLLFLQTVKDENGAQTRLDDIVYSEVRRELGLHSLTDIVSGKREEIMNFITKRCDEKARDYGIRVLDVRIKRCDLPPENEEYVFGRMRAERERKAKMYRSEGEEEALKIRAETDKQRELILAEARKRASIIRGIGDATAAKIYANAYGQDPSFYAYLRTLEAYKKCLEKDTTFILSSESEFFEYLK
jgi:membrane protease subunit HflC